MTDDKYEQIWKSVWEKVTEGNIGASQINAFFSRLHPQAFSDGFLMLTAETDFIKKWVEANYIHDIENALNELYNGPFTVAIEVDPIIPAQNASSPQAPTQNPPADTIQVPSQLIEQTRTKDDDFAHPSNEPSLISEYSFDNFVVGSSNQLAYSMALSVAENPGQEELNPLFLYGKSGLGKTHLLRAIQNYVNANYPHLKTVYVDTDALVNDYTEASINKSFNSFKQRYNEADMVLIDDVQSLQGREGSINMVFQLFNNLKSRGKQIVLSADRAPKHIDIDERSQTRFNSGGTCDIKPPELETKLGIISNFVDKAKETGEYKFTISPEIQEYVAQNSGSNIRELKSAITKIFQYGDAFNKEELTIEEVYNLLRDHFSGGAMKKLTVPEIQSAVEQFFNISHADLVGKKRSANISHARQVGIYLCRTMIDISHESIGKEFNRDHATVMYSVTQIEERLKESREQNEEIEIIKQMIMEQ